MIRGRHTSASQRGAADGLRFCRTGQMGYTASHCCEISPRYLLYASARNEGKDSPMSFIWGWANFLIPMGHGSIPVKDPKGSTLARKITIAWVSVPHSSIHRSQIPGESRASLHAPNDALRSTLVPQRVLPLNADRSQ